MIAAKRQIAVYIGDSKTPYFLTARGSTEAGRKLKICYEAQKVSGNENNTKQALSNVERIAAIEAEIADLEAELYELIGD